MQSVRPRQETWQGARMTLPTDSHVHTEWSWDSPNGAMQATCARAAELGLPALAFTDHMDFDPWQVEEGELDGVEHLKTFLTEDNSAVAPPLMDADGYLECVERCRGQFPVSGSSPVQNSVRYTATKRRRSSS